MVPLPNTQLNASLESGYLETPQELGASPQTSDLSLQSQVTTKSDADQNALLEEGRPPQQQYRLYRRRFFGLAQLTLVVMMVQLNEGVFGNVTTYASEYFSVSIDSINWLGIAFSIAFLPPCPLVIWVLNKSGPKLAIIIATVLLVAGAWIRYAGTVARNFPAVMVGQVVIAFANTFVLPAPTRYSQLWFSKEGRTSATGISSLAAAAGGAIGGAIANPLLSALGMKNYVLVTAVITTAVCLPAPFIPKAPPTPASAASAAPKLNLRETIRLLSNNRPFYLMFVSFSVFVGAFQASTIIISQAVIPYHLTQTNAALAASFMVIFGVVAAIVVSPLLDRTGSHLIVVKCMTPIIASGYLTLAFIPQTNSVAGLYIVFSLIGASAFAIMPGTLEFQAAWTFPASPEISSIICWAGGQTLTAVFVLIEQSLVNTHTTWGQPPGSAFRGLIFQAIIVWLVVPLTMLTGFGIFKKPATALAE